MFDGELSFALKLAREMGRPDWRAMLAGGVRFGPDVNEVIPVSPDVADMTEDDVMLMTVSEGIAGGVRYG
ncbi:TPA: hypothetical protein KMM20_001311 [Escherichia coli]|nr:hypothetical protein [Escherichia coli]